MDQAEEIRDVLKVQDDLIQQRVVWDVEPWLELEMSTPQFKALLLISEEEGTRMRELARMMGGSFSNATVLVDRLVERGSWSVSLNQRTGGSCSSASRRRGDA
jgi:DNA-binding MarR family transcriptional regulator